MTSIYKQKGVCILGSERSGFALRHTAKGRKKQNWISAMLIVHLPLSEGVCVCVYVFRG